MSTEITLFPDLTKMMQQFKVPGFDMAPIIESRRKDIEAISVANQATVEAVQALARKQGEILKQAMQEIQDSVQATTAGGTGAAAQTKQTELVRSAYEKMLADLKEMAEMAQKSQVDVMAGITKRGSESMQETVKMLKPK